MSDREALAECGTDVLVSFSESLHIYTGLLTVASVCGVLSGILTAALLHNFCLKPLLLTRQGYNIRRLLEPEDAELDNNQSDCVSNGKNDAPTVSAKDKEKKPPLVNSDVAAFATRAKVVYPINQKYRPLADGASNPSLHEASKLPPMPPDSSSSSDEESLSEGQENEEDSPYVSSSLLPRSLQNHSFSTVSSFPLTLTLTGVESRINLYCLALRDVEQSCLQLQEEKSLIYSQMLKNIFGNRFPKNKQESDFYKNVLLTQEKELNEFKKLLPSSPSAPEKSESVVCTLEEMERAQKELLERGLQMCKSFSKQVENLSQHLLKKISVFSPEEAQDVISSITKNLLLVETHLKSVQDSNLKRIQQKVLWWEELTALLQSQPALLKQEVSLMQSSITTALEQLTSDDVLTFSQMEKILSEVQGALSDGLKQYNQECMKKTKDVVTEKMNKLESKRRKLLKNQNKEKSRALDQTQSELQELLKVHEELVLKHREQMSDLEQQQDDRVTEAVCELWTKLRSSWSTRLRDQSRDVFLSSVSSESSLSLDQCERLWVSLDQDLSEQLLQAENRTREQLQEIRAQLDREAQTWTEEMTLVETGLKNLTEQQTKILQALVLRQSYSLHDQVGRLMAQKHLHLLRALQRLFVVRHFSLSLLKEMRLSKLRVLCLTDFRSALMDETGRNQACASSNVKNSSASLAERHLGPESVLVGHSLQQEFLSELETGTELLQNHVQGIMGNALSHAVQQVMETQPTEELSSSTQDYNMKCHLTEAASESVYLTKDSLTALVKNYYSQLETIVQKLYQEPPELSDDEDEKQESSSQIIKAVLRELENWSKKPTSAEFQQRVELHKRRLLEQSDREQERMFEELRHKKVSREITLDKIKAQLMEAEEGFIEELAALARVSLHKEEAEPTEEEQDNICDPSINIRELLALNPALDPALNPSLTPTIIAPPVKIVVKEKKKT